MINHSHFRRLVIDPTLVYLGLYSKAASNLLLGTAVQESRLEYMKQLLGGPALGFFQIEPFTLNDVYHSFLDYRPELKMKLNYYQGSESREDALVTNLKYSAAVCRIIYYRAPEKLPKEDDISGLARYWKVYYNTSLGAGTRDEFINNYNKHKLGVV